MGRYELIDTPAGTLFAGGSAAGLHRIEFLDDPQDAPMAASRLAAEIGEPVAAGGGGGVVARAAAQLGDYFGGQRRTFNLPLAPHGTAFQQAVWRELLAIPWGATSSYGAIASAIGRPGSSRAVGAAIGRNPLSIAVPCHRVIGANGALTGYAFGLERKRWLLEHEGAALPVMAPRLATTRG